MQYFIMFPDDKEKEVTFESNLLGESSFKVFWGGEGLKKLMWMQLPLRIFFTIGIKVFI